MQLYSNKPNITDIFVFIYPSQRVLKQPDPDNITLLLYRIVKEKYLFVKSLYCIYLYQAYLRTRKEILVKYSHEI